MKTAFEITQKVVMDEEGIISVEVVRIKEIDINKRYSESEEEDDPSEQP